MKIAKRCLCSILILGILFSLSGCNSFSEEDAKDMVQANLDLWLQGDAHSATKVLDSSYEELVQQYRDGVTDFIANNITGDLLITDSHFLLYHRLFEELFRSSKYRVMDANKTENGTFMVRVEIQPLNIFEKAMPQIEETAMQIEEQAVAGFYVGNDIAKQEQMTYEFLAEVYQILETAYKNAEFGERIEAWVLVEKNKGGSFHVTPHEQFLIIEKILGLDTMLG